MLLSSDTSLVSTINIDDALTIYPFQEIGFIVLPKIACFLLFINFGRLNRCHFPFLPQLTSTYALILFAYHLIQFLAGEINTESKLRHNRRRSGYEPSDTETNWVDSPRRETQNKGFDMQSRSRNPLDGVEVMQSAGIIVEIEAPFSGSSRRRHSISPYKPRGEHSNPPSDNYDLPRNHSPCTIRTYSDLDRNLIPFSMSNRRTNPDGSENNDYGAIVCEFTQSKQRTNTENYIENASPFSESERRRYVSPYKNGGKIHCLVYQESNHDSSRGREKSNYSRRTASAPRTRFIERGQQIKYDHGYGTKFSPLAHETPHKHVLSGSEINEIIANEGGSEKWWC